MYRRLASVLVAAAVSSWGDPPVEAGQEPSPARVQLEAGEFGAAQELARQSVAQLEYAGTRYHSELVEPLTILGDANLALGDTDAAIAAYERARYVLRTNDGLYSMDQVDLLYREADAYRRARDTKTANDRNEYAFRVRLQQGQSSDLVPAVVRLAEWYESMSHVGVARDLYREALEIAEIHAPEDDVLEARLKRRLARTYRSQFFPPYKAARGAFVPRPHGSDWRDQEHIYIRFWGYEHYRRGKTALNEALEAFRQDTDAHLDEVVATMLDLGDWLMLAKRYRIAFDTYADLYELLEVKDPPRLQEVFGEPKVLHMSCPGNPIASAPRYDEPLDGFIDISLSVDEKGRARNVATIRSRPNDLVGIKYRKAVRYARFRPAFVDGVSVQTDNVKVEHSFKYFP